MSEELRWRMAAENVALFDGADAADLLALRVALHVEDALQVTLPDDVLDGAHLGTPEALEATLAAVLGDD